MNFISEWVQKLSLPKILAYATVFTTTVISATWIVATRIADSKADYVNMRYDEIRNAQEQLSQLQEENEKLRAKLNVEPAKSSPKSTTQMEVKEFDKVGITFIEPMSNVMITVLGISTAYKDVDLQFTFPNGGIDKQTFRVGSSYVFEMNGKKYQLFATEFSENKMKYFVRELPQ